MHEKNATNSPAAQTVCHFSHNADFYRLRISKYPANAHKMNYFSALCTGSGENVGLKILCVHTKFLRGVEVGRDGDGIEVKVGCYSEKWDDEKGNMLTIMGFQSIMMAGELGGNIG